MTNIITTIGQGSREIASGTASMTTALIAAGAAGATVTVPAPGVLATDTVNFSFSASPGVNPGVLQVNAWPTADNVNFAFVNPTAAGVTPAASTLNWRILR